MTRMSHCCGDDERHAVGGPEVRTEISCSIRCLDPEAARRARERAETERVVRVPYVCKISGEREEIVLLGRAEARRVATAAEELEDALDARIVAAVAATELCECDVATLTGVDEGEVLERLARLEERGLLGARPIEGMRYFRAVPERLPEGVDGSP